MTQTCQIGLYLFFIALLLLSTNNTCSAFGAESSPRQQITEVHCTLTSLPRSHGERFLPYLEIASPQESCVRVGQLTAQGHAVRSRGWAGCQAQSTPTYSEPTGSSMKGVSCSKPESQKSRQNKQLTCFYLNVEIYQ